MFLYFDLFIIALGSSLVMKEASFALRYFFSDRCMFIENEKDWFLKQIKSVSFKEQKLWISDLRGVIVIVFVVPIRNNFHKGWSFWEEFIWRVLFRYWSRNHCIATWFRRISISPAMDGLRSLNLNKRYNIWKKSYRALLLGCCSLLPGHLTLTGLFVST